jgi:hypothetical protein
MAQLAAIAGEETFAQFVTAIAETARDVVVFADIGVGVVRGHY